MSRLGSALSRGIDWKVSLLLTFQSILRLEVKHLIELDTVTLSPGFSTDTKVQRRVRQHQVWSCFCLFLRVPFLLFGLVSIGLNLVRFVLIPFARFARAIGGVRSRSDVSR